ncbi:1,2-phenylacetyl-CoA epoxidase subunit PaaD [Deinococcus peraridilitoris]|uniref:Phenylacetate-CoA oxygenase, PaaJ subunit n=1 Tax=Deinococcus peraridilitoris (strain DSM 19664 / LMG 22246 / CIP 109416 / KR-200) TaxID=937777 RepID=K9ZXS3_DEIPD|nr:1,2-phenylacetyl-CoA epoxidase subunit PaaD [Deinococcus peraridilitoris]AFZ66396.1 phenylacetate-CoA oxygenase, PaaJ subunit [Deinococcus peraridilitoris DSM 19664]
MIERPTVLPSEAEVWAALSRVPDPEIPVVNIVEMGIVREVQLDGARATVRMTPTFSACPALHVIREDIARAVRSLGLQVQVDTVMFPPWTTDWITEEARTKLSVYGIAPPGASDDGALLQLQSDATRCPRCGSFDTRIKNTFGPTLCKTIHVCGACREPFEAFKTV